MTMRISRLAPAALVALLAAGACSDSGPGGPDPDGFDPQAVNGNLQAVSAVMASGVWESFRTLGPQFGAGAAAFGAAAIDAFQDATTPQSAPQAAALAAQRVLAAARLVPRIPFDVRGTTFVLDPATLHYVPDPTREGAPANGVRFILYGMNPVTRQPLLDVEIGHADLSDEGDALPDRIALRLEVVSDGVTYLDYRVSAGGTETAGSITAVGFVTDGTTRLEFDIAVAGMQGPGEQSLEVRFTLTVPERGFHASATVHNVSATAGGTSDVALEIGVGDAVITFTAHGTPDRIDAEFRVNGRLFATVTGDPRNPEITGADGRELTPDEREALGQIMGLTGMVFEMFDALMQPVGAILGAGVPA